MHCESFCVETSHAQAVTSFLNPKITYCAPITFIFSCDSQCSYKALMVLIAKSLLTVLKIAGDVPMATARHEPSLHSLDM